MSTSCSRSQSLRFLLTLALALSLAVGGWPRPQRAANQQVSGAAGVPAETLAETEERAREAFGRLGVSFEENRGQVDGRVRFLSRSRGATVFLTAEEAAFVMRAPEPRDGAAAERQTAKEGFPGAHGTGRPRRERPKSHAVYMKFEGANPRAEIVGERELPGRVNYLRGSDPSKWRANVRTYGAVRYREIYEGIDLVYYGNKQGEMEYDFEVAPGADPRRVSLKIEGAEAVKVDAAGGLVISTPVGEMRQRKPTVYQNVKGARREVEGGYAVEAGGRVRFALGGYDKGAPLVIDPAVEYSTYLSGRYLDFGYAIAADSAGNAYVTGWTASTNFPSGNALDSDGGYTEAFVTKLKASGSALVYSTYLGGSSEDEGHGIAVDSSGNAYVTGRTASTDFPTTNAFQGALGGGYMDTFITKLNPAGSALVYSTYLGGSSDEEGQGIAVDPSGNAYVTGWTASTDFPTANAILSDGHVFVTKINAAGSSLVYSTRLGGGDVEQGTGIAADPSGNAYVTGWTHSTDFPVVNAFQATHGGGYYDAFVVKLNAAGSSLIYSTYLGGSGAEQGADIAADPSGNAYVTGYTGSDNFPTLNPLQSAFGGSYSDAFVTKLNPTGTALVYSTYLGGSDMDGAGGIAADPAGNAYVAGGTRSSNFPTANAIPGQESRDGAAFVTSINADGSAFLYSTYLGNGPLNEGYPTGASGIAVDSASNVYVTGSTWSAGFVLPFGFQNRRGGAFDAFVAKITTTPFIRGRAVAQGGAGEVGIPWVTVKLTGAQTMTTLTDARGYYGFTGLAPGGDYTVTASKGDLLFAPASRSFTDLHEFLYDVNFGAPTLGVPDIAVTEGNTGEATATFTVRLQPASTEPVTVKYRTTAGTAAAGSEYTPLPLTPLTFEPGETAKTVSVTFKGDALDEPKETFRLLLSEPTNALLPRAYGVCTIVDDDPRPSLSVHRTAVTESDWGVTARFTVTLSAPSEFTVKVNYQTADGTATAPADYTAKALTTLTFAPGQTTKNVSVTVKGDTLDEATETFKLKLSSAVNATIAVGAELCFITDDD